MVVQNQQELGEGSTIPTDPHHTPTIIQPSTSQPQKTQKPRKPKRKDTQVPQPSGLTNIVADEAVHKELGDSLVRAATTASSLEAEQDNTRVESSGDEEVLEQEVAAKDVNLTVDEVTLAQALADLKSVKSKIVDFLNLQALVDRKKIVVTEASVRRDLQLEDADGVDCLLNATIFKQLTLMGMVKNLGTAVKFLMYTRFVQVFLNNQLEGMATHNRIYIAPSHTKKLFANMRRQGKDFSGRVIPLFPPMVVQAQEEMGEGYKNQEGLRRRTLRFLIQVVPMPTNRFTDEAVMRSLRVRSLKRIKEVTRETHKLKRLYRVGRSKRVVSSEEESLGNQKDASKQGRIDDIDVDKDIYLVNVHRDEDMFEVNDLEGDEIVVESEVADKDVNLSVDEVTLAQALVALKSAKVQEKGDVIKEPSVPVSAASTKQEQEQAPTPIVSSKQPTQVKDKGKAKMVEEEPKKKMSKKELLKLDEELAFKLQAEEDEEERLAREKAQKVEEANIAWDDIQAKVEADYQLAQRLQAQEQEELSDVKRLHYFSKRAGDEIEQENAKKQKMDDNQEAAKMKELIKIVPDEEEVAVDAIPLATKPPSIVDWKIVKEGNICYYQIIRADGSSRRYSAFIQILRSFDREDLETLWKLVKAKHGYTRPEEGYERVLWGDLKIMFEHNVIDVVWRNLCESKVLVWKLFDSCGVHFVSFLSSSQSNSRINEVFGSILLVIDEAFNEET
ncbi:hypothetical protein Tco_1103175 [Tanacetum coccineum]